MIVDMYPLIKWQFPYILLKKKKYFVSIVLFLKVVDEIL